MAFSVLNYNIVEGGDGRLPLMADVILRRLDIEARRLHSAMAEQARQADEVVLVAWVT